LKPDDSPLDGRRGIRVRCPRLTEPPAIAGGAVATAGQQYIVRSLELATRAFQDPGRPGPSHDWHVQPVVKDQIRSPPERRVSVEPAIHSDGVSSKLVHLLQSSPTCRDEPFKLTAAVHNVSTESRIKSVINADSLHSIVFHSEHSEESYCAQNVSVR